MTRSIFALPLLLAVTLPACGSYDGRGTPSDEPVAKASSAITNGFDFFWGQFGNENAGVHLTDLASHTCFLGGVHGELLGTNNGGEGLLAGGQVFMDQTAGDWKAVTDQGDGDGFNIQGRCIPFTGNRVTLDTTYAPFTYDGYNTVTQVQSVPGTPGRQCFLTGIWSHRGFTSLSDQAILRPPSADTNFTWQLILETSPLWSGNSVYPGGTAQAVCVDVPTPDYGAVDRESSTPWHFTTETAIECGLAVIAGSFLTTDNSGMAVTTDSTGWTIVSTSTKLARAYCAK